MNTSWITDNLRSRIRKIFEPRYCRALNDEEVEEIAENLTGYMETILKFKWRTEYANTID